MLTAALKRPVKHYTVSRISTGERPPKADELDALRELLGTTDGRPLTPSTIAPRAPKLTNDPQLIPLYGLAGSAPQTLRLGEGHIVGVVPVHPAQRGSHEPFAFIVPDNRLADRLLRGETAYALRNRPPLEGQMVAVEMASGEVLPHIFVREDERTYYLKVKKPEEKGVTIPRDQVIALHVIVGATYGFA